MYQLAVYPLLVIVGIGLGYGFRGFIRRELQIGAGMAVSDFLKVRAEIQALEKELKDKLIAEIQKV